MSKKFLALITRHKDEPFLRQFCLYYITQGIDDIYIIDDNSKDKKTLKELDFYFKNIHITYDNDIIKKNSIKKVYQSIKESFTWIIHVDVDEYIENIHKQGLAHKMLIRGLLFVIIIL